MHVPLLATGILVPPVISLRVTLTSDHSLCVLRHKNHAHFLSAEVSKWFWEGDLLQSKLRQVQKPVWGRLLWEQQARPLFRELRDGGHCEEVLKLINIYSLEE